MVLAVEVASYLAEVGLSVEPNALTERMKDT